MIFLIEYDRTSGKLKSLRQFDDNQRQKAQEEQLSLELELGKKRMTHEVVILEADSEAALHRTHQRYFADLQTMIQTTGQAVQQANIHTF